jgi:hypothetical protein
MNSKRNHPPPRKKIQIRKGISIFSRFQTQHVVANVCRLLFIPRRQILRMVIEETVTDEFTVEAPENNISFTRITATKWRMKSTRKRNQLKDVVTLKSEEAETEEPEDEYEQVELELVKCSH